MTPSAVVAEGVTITRTGLLTLASITCVRSDGSVAEHYKVQCQGQLWVAEREWTDMRPKSLRLAMEADAAV